jgi:hypothetical protein
MRLMHNRDVYSHWKGKNKLCIIEMYILIIGRGKTSSATNCRLTKIHIFNMSTCNRTANIMF